MGWLPGCNSIRRRPRRSVPEAWFRIVHVSADHVKGSVELREQTVEVALGPDGAFQNANVGRLTRQVRAERVVCALAPPRYPGKSPARLEACPRRPDLPKEPRTPPVVQTLRKALEWRRQLDAGEVANQAAIARREGISRARVTQILALLRLAPAIKDQVLTAQPSIGRATMSERLLRSFARVDEGRAQLQAFRAALGDHGAGRSNNIRPQSSCTVAVACIGE